MIPKYKIETYTGAILDYTITEDAFNIHVKDTLNDVGTFNFCLPTVKGTTNLGYIYTDIALNDTVKFYFWYADIESAPATPNFVGKVCKISAPLTSESGYYRVFEGKLLTEILTRRLKRNKSWIAVDANVIVTELANDLSLGTGEIAADTTDATLHVDVESYFDVLKKISDYWYDAGTQIKKDFYVDADNDLVWKARPLRTAGVESLTVGENIENYDILRDIEAVKNYITVYGTNGTNAQEGRCEPSDHDSWTYGSGWTADYGTQASSVTYKVLGANSLLLSSQVVSGKATIKCYYSFSTPLQGMGRSGYQILKFWIERDLLGAVPTTAHVRLRTDSSNYFYRNIVTPASSLSFTAVSSDLGDSQEYNSVLNPNGIWEKQGTPDWFNINSIEYFFERTDTSDMYFYIDALYFSRGRYRSATSDATSISNYGQRDLDIIDDTLKSDAECQTRAETLLYQLKDAPIRIEIETQGNTNILIGDRLSMTIPAEGISTSNYDVLIVVDDFTKDKFQTKVSLVNAGDIRQLPCATPMESTLRKAQLQREISKGVQIWK